MFGVMSLMLKKWELIEGDSFWVHLADAFIWP